jgi:hypothetical protein
MARLTKGDVLSLLHRCAEKFVYTWVVFIISTMLEVSLPWEKLKTVPVLNYFTTESYLIELINWKMNFPPTWTPSWVRGRNC